MNCEKFFEKTLESEMKLALEKDIKKEEQKKNTIIENPDINIFRIQSKFMGKLIKKKKIILFLKLKIGNLLII